MDPPSRRHHGDAPSSGSRRVSASSFRQPQQQQNHQKQKISSSPRSSSTNRPQYLLNAPNENSSNVRLPQSYSSAATHQQAYHSSPRHHNQNQNDLHINPNTAYNGSMHRDRSSLRRRGSSPMIEPNAKHRLSSHHHVRQANNNHPIQSPLSVNYGTEDGFGRGQGSNGRHTSIQKHTRNKGNATTSSSLRRWCSLLLLCMIILWGSLWGIGTGFSIVRGTINFIIGTSRDDQTIDTDKSSDSEDEFRPSFHVEKKMSKDSADKTTKKNKKDHDEGQSSSTENLSAHDLNALSHQKKAEGRQIINDRPLEFDDEGEGDKSYMGNDSTLDFFFAGAIVEKKRIVNSEGRIETTYDPAHSYATLPLSMDANPFVMSLWVYLAPLNKDNENKKDGGVFEDNRRPRVILSTRPNDGSSGCYSDVFGVSTPAANMVLYAQPHFGDKGGDSNHEEDGKTYRINLEYTQQQSKECRTLVGSNQKALLVREGNWHHIALFVTQLQNKDEERISLYVNGDMAGRVETETQRFPSPSSAGMKTIIGRYATQGGNLVSQVEIDNDNFDLGGRVGMLSFWETGDRGVFSRASDRMELPAIMDEEHVVRAIERASFDIQAIKDISLTGLAVKKPALLYTFDGHRNATQPDLYADSPREVKEVMSGNSGSIIAELAADGMPAHQKPAFIPLGGRRYSEYRDGTYMTPKLKTSERIELHEIARARKSVVKKAMKHVWKGYKDYAFGKDELLPLSKGGQDNWGGQGTTLIDSLGTLWLMGLEKQFYEARDWVRDYLDFNAVKGGVSVFETTIRSLGGLLSAYDLSGDKVFLDKADDLGMRLMKAFATRSGIPYGECELFDGGRAYNAGWHSKDAVLSEIGTLQVEFRYLAKVTGKREYETSVMRALDEVLKLDADHGLYPTYISNTGQQLGFGNSEISLGAMGDSFYEYLLKIWLQGGKKEHKYRRLYDKSIRGIMDKLIHMSRPDYLTYVAEMKNDRVVHKMDHLSCFLGGTLALGAYTHPDGLESVEARKQLKTGKQLAYTCYQMYARSKSGLAPEFVKFDTSKDDFVKGSAPYYILRPETVETFYILFHLTKDPVYREWGWEIFQAIEENCKTDAGYAAIRDVDTMKQDNRMESFFLAETLKYLYLLQDDTSEIDLLNTHVFNTEAHPLRLLRLAPES